MDQNGLDIRKDFSKLFLFLYYLDKIIEIKLVHLNRQDFSIL
jgi:hypothetical protein